MTMNNKYKSLDILRWESFAKSNFVLGFNHLNPVDYPTMSTHQRGLCINIQSIVDWTPPNLGDNESNKTITRIHMNVALYHLKTQSFFGSTWRSPELQYIETNDNRETVKIDELVYLVTRITDPACVCISEIVLSNTDKRGVLLSQIG